MVSLFLSNFQVAKNKKKKAYSLHLSKKFHFHGHHPHRFKPQIMSSPNDPSVVVYVFSDLLVTFLNVSLCISQSFSVAPHYKEQGCQSVAEAVHVRMLQNDVKGPTDPTEYTKSEASQVVLVVKNLPANVET